MTFFGLPRQSGTEQIGRIKRWIREAASLPETAVVMVTELTCSEPGCPPRETVILILDGRGTRKVTLLKGLTDVTEADVVGATWAPEPHGEP